MSQPRPWPSLRVHTSSEPSARTAAAREVPATTWMSQRHLFYKAAGDTQIHGLHSPGESAQILALLPKYGENEVAAVAGDTLPSSTHVNNGVSVVDPGSSRCPLEHTLAPLGCLRKVNCSPLLGLSSEAQVSAHSSSKHPQMHIWAGECSEVAWTLCAGLYLFCLPQIGCFTLF